MCSAVPNGFWFIRSVKIRWSVIALAYCSDKEQPGECGFVADNKDQSALLHKTKRIVSQRSVFVNKVVINLYLKIMTGEYL